MPTVFDRLYPIPPEKRDQPDWFESIDVVSHPYDPLLVVSCFHGHMFQGEYIRMKRMGLLKFWPFSTGIRHLIIGSQNEGHCGVPQPEVPYKELKRAVTAGVSGSKPRPIT